MKNPMLRTALRFIVVPLVVVIAEIGNAVQVGAVEPDIRQVKAVEMEQRGKELRAALQRTYDTLRVERKLSGGGTDITDSVLPYIRPGTSFGDAEIILRSAGFTVTHPASRPPENLNRSKDWYAVTARIFPFATEFPMTADLIVTLLPKSPGDYSTVREVSAKLYASMP